MSRAILIDLDGVLYVGDRAVAGAREALDWLAAESVPHLFLTNTTSRSRAVLVDKLRGLGFEIPEAGILTPPVAAARWLEARGIRRIAPFVPERTRGEFERLHCESGEAPVEAVVVGDLGEAWDFATLNRAFRLLMAEPRPVLVALGMTRYWRAPDGLRLDTAPFVMALAHATGIEPEVLGKPARAFFDTALAMLGVAPDACFMIGDDVVSDVGGAQACGIRGLLVRTGKFRPGDLDGEVRPHGVLDSIADLPEWWRTHGDG